MRDNFPISSQEFNDIIIEAYGNLCYLLGYRDSDNNVYSGIYEVLESSGNAYLGSISGILHTGNIDAKYQMGLDEETTSDKLIQYLKFDYIYRKSLGYI